MSSNVNEIILDPFLWSWTTWISTILASGNRKLIWFEKNIDNYNLSIEKIKQYI